MNNGKSSSSCLIFVLIVVMAGYITYNEMRMKQVKAALSAPPARAGASGRPGEPGISGLVDPLVSGRRHAQRAQKFLKDKKYDQAEAELTKAVNSLKDAQDAAEGMYGGAQGILGNARNAASSVIQRTREGIGGLTRRRQEPEKKGKEKP